MRSRANFRHSPSSIKLKEMVPRQQRTNEGDSHWMISSSVFLLHIWFKRALNVFLTHSYIICTQKPF